MMTISILALKGGVGKTTTTINLADSLTARGYRVLCVDADPQANLTRFFGGSGTEPGTYELLSGLVEDYGEVVCGTANNRLDYIPASMDLFLLDAQRIRHAVGACSFLNLRSAVFDEEEYDFILIDCPPGFSAAAVAAIVASQLLIVPANADAYSASGLHLLHREVQELVRRNSLYLKMEVLMTRQERNDLSAEAERLLRQAGFSMFSTCIRSSPKVSESTFMRQTLNEYSRWCSAARDYRALAEELVAREVGNDG